MPSQTDPLRVAQVLESYQHTKLDGQQVRHALRFQGHFHIWWQLRVKSN